MPVPLQRNAMALVPKLDQRAEVARDLRAIFNSMDPKEADARLKTLARKRRRPFPTSFQRHFCIDSE
jgi:transposase-like protein